MPGIRIWPVSTGGGGYDTPSGSFMVRAQQAALPVATDGFTEYGRVFGSRPRWGDYGAVAVDGNSIWIASEYIAQTCTLAQWEMAPLGQCGGTRTGLINWATRISEINTVSEISVSGP